MTPLKNTNISPKIWCFLEKNIRSYFPKIFSEIFIELAKNNWFYMILAN